MQTNDTKPRKRYRTVPRVCESCGVPFFAYPYEVRRGVGRFCSRSCGKRKELAVQVLPRLAEPNENGCRAWMAARDWDGYGKVTVNGVPKRATHAVWFLNTGHWPAAGEIIAHVVCDWPPCCEFSHLSLTDLRGNVDDMLSKNRQARGERQWQAKLTADDVAAMRAKYAAGGVSMPALAAEYGVSYATARSAINGEHWKHV